MMSYQETVVMSKDKGFGPEVISQREPSHNQALASWLTDSASFSSGSLGIAKWRAVRYTASTVALGSLSLSFQK